MFSQHQSNIFHTPVRGSNTAQDRVRDDLGNLLASGLNLC